MFVKIHVLLFITHHFIFPRFEGVRFFIHEYILLLMLVASMPTLLILVALMLLLLSFVYIFLLLLLLLIVIIDIHYIGFILGSVQIWVRLYFMIILKNDQLLSDQNLSEIRW